MATNLAIDEKLLDEAKSLGYHKSKKETVNVGLMEYIQQRKQSKVIELFRKIEYDKKYNYKKGRTR